MGVFPASAIEDAAEYLLTVLLERGSLPYSTFYDGTDETHERLIHSIGQEDDWYSPEHLIDLAVFQLEDLGIVETEPLPSKLADGFDDYRIELTAEGRDFITCGFKPDYRDME